MPADHAETKEELIAELEFLRQRNAELGALAAGDVPAHQAGVGPCPLKGPCWNERPGVCARATL